MKKTTRNILIMLAVLVVLGGAAAALLLTQPGESGDGSSSAPSAVSSQAEETVMDREPDQISSISVENGKDSYTFLPADPDEDREFVLDGCEGYDVSSSSVDAAVKSLLPLKAKKDLGQREDLENFGLSGDSAAHVVIKYKDGEEDQLVIGNEAGETVGRYFLKDGIVYIVNGIAERLFEDKFAYFNLDLYAIPDRTESVDNGDGTTSVQTAKDRMDRISFSGTNFPELVEIEYDGGKLSQYVMTAPVTAESGGDNFTEMFTSIKALTADKAVAAGLTDEVLEQYGLKEPFAKVDFQLNSEPHVLAVSDKDSDGNRYLIADDRDVVYQVAAETVSAWAEIRMVDLRMSYVFIPNIQDVEHISFTVDGDKKYAFDVTRTKNEEKSTEDKTSYDLAVKNDFGAEIAYENYQHFYMKMLSISVLSSDHTEFSGTPALKIEYSYFDGNNTDTVEYYAVKDDRYAAVLNGEFNGLVRRSEADKVAGEIARLYNGETVEKDY